MTRKEHSKKKVEPKWLHSGAIFMSTGWPPFLKVCNLIIKEKMAPPLKSGTVFPKGSTVEPIFFQ